ncbi:MAG: hypothetical protein JWQ18_783, partial [Conexibacter sp.]|nr:hypothetical protein [Conexibacter sp.]
MVSLGRSALLSLVLAGAVALPAAPASAAAAKPTPRAHLAAFGS